MELDDSKQKITGGQRGIQLKLLQASLPEYKHINKEMPWSRFWFLVKKGSKVCNCMALKTDERKALAQFSIPISVALPNQIIMRKQTYGELGSPASLSLVDLMQDQRLIGLLIENRSYSHRIDKLLRKNEKGSNTAREFIDEQRLLKVLANKRADYTLEYPFVVTNTVNKYLPELKDTFVCIPIAEIDPFYYAFVACPKTEWGKRVILKINESLKKLRPTKSFRNAMKMTYSGESLKIIYNYYDEHLLSNN